MRSTVLPTAVCYGEMWVQSHHRRQKSAVTFCDKCATVHFDFVIQLCSIDRTVFFPCPAECSMSLVITFRMRCATKSLCVENLKRV